MNHQELVAHTKLSATKVNDILTAAQMPSDSLDYTPEQVKVVEEIINLVETKQAKTYKEAGELYRKPLHEHQLQEIALRYCQTERIPEITAALKLKLGSVSEEQFAAFQSVCEQVQQGMDLGMVAQAALDKAKASKGKKAASMPELLVQPIEPPQEGAITVVERDVEIQVAGDTPQELMFKIPENVSENLESLAKTSTLEITEEYIKGATTQILEQDPQEAFQQGQQYGQALIEKARRDYLQSPDASAMVGRIIALVKKNLGQKSE